MTSKEKCIVLIIILIICFNGFNDLSAQKTFEEKKQIELDLEIYDNHLNTTIYDKKLSISDNLVEFTKNEIINNAKVEKYNIANTGNKVMRVMIDEITTTIKNIGMWNTKVVINIEIVDKNENELYNKKLVSSNDTPNYWGYKSANIALKKTYLLALSKISWISIYLISSDISKIDVTEYMQLLESRNYSIDDTNRPNINKLLNGGKLFLNTYLECEFPLESNTEIFVRDYYGKKSEYPYFRIGSEFRIGDKYFTELGIQICTPISTFSNDLNILGIEGRIGYGRRCQVGALVFNTSFGAYYDIIFGKEISFAIDPGLYMSIGYELLVPFGVDNKKMGGLIVNTGIKVSKNISTLGKLKVGYEYKL